MNMLRLVHVILTEESVCFKIAIKIPIAKSHNGKNSGFDDHRGISLLPAFDKILPRIILNRIQSLHKSIVSRELTKKNKTL
jgi:hypothetical protein